MLLVPHLTMLLLIFALQVLSIYGHSTVPGEKCDRQCDGNRLQCVFYLTMDRFVTASPNCGDCFNGNYKDCRRPLCVPGDGNVRMIIAFNGTVPGPRIVVCQNDVIVINFHCSIDPETCALHSHGMLQRGSNTADGVPWVTQYPIYSGHTFVYKYVARESGSHFYHAHAGLQRANGAYGYLIVRKPLRQEAYSDYDFDSADHYLSVLDWFPSMAIDYLTIYQRTSDLFTGNNISGIIVNGHLAKPNGRVLPYRIVVQHGKSYRIRTLHAGNMVCPMEMSIQGHSMFAFQSDGSDFRRQEFSTITLANGERFDFILLANQPPGVYSIKFVAGLICFNKVGVVELVYEGSTGAATHDWGASSYGTGSRLNCIFNHDSRCVAIHQLTALKPNVREVTSPPQFLGLNVELTTHFKYRGGARSAELQTPYLNNITYVPPQIPFYRRMPSNICNNERRLNCRGPYCECTYVMKIPRYSVVDFIYYDMGTYLDLVHPMHIHGYKMSILCVIKLGTMVMPEVIRAMYNNGTLYNGCNFKNPLQKDTVQVPDGGYTIARIYFDNPGPWFAHCHGELHTLEGMAFTIVVS